MSAGSATKNRGASSPLWGVMAVQRNYGLGALFTA